MSEPPRSATAGSQPTTIIGPKHCFRGLVHLREPARIDGEIDGEIIATAAVWVGETGRVRARVEAPEVVIAGELEGDIVASRRVELTATGRMKGSVESPLFALAEGGVLDGHCRTGRGAREP